MTTPAEVTKYEPQRSTRESRMRNDAMSSVFDGPHPHREVLVHESRDPDIMINEIQRFFPDIAQSTDGVQRPPGIKEIVGRLVEQFDIHNMHIGTDRGWHFYRGAHDLSGRYRQYPVGFCDQVATDHPDCVTSVAGDALSEIYSRALPIRNDRSSMPPDKTSEYIFDPAGTGTLKLIARVTPSTEVGVEEPDAEAQYRCVDLDALYARDPASIQRYFIDRHALYTANSVLNHLGYAHLLDSATDEDLIPKELKEAVIDPRFSTSLNTLAYFLKSRSDRVLNDLFTPITNPLVNIMRRGVKLTVTNPSDDQSSLSLDTPAYLQHRIKHGSMHPNSLKPDEYAALEEFMFVLDDVTDTAKFRHIDRDERAAALSQAVKDTAYDDLYRTRVMHLSYRLVNADESLSKAGEVHNEAYADFRFFKALTVKSLEVIAGETNHPMHGHPITQLYRDLVAVDGGGAQLQRILKDLKFKRSYPAPVRYHWEPAGWLGTAEKPPNEFAETVQLKGSLVDEQINGFNARLHADHKLWKAFADALRVEEINQFKITRLVSDLFSKNTSEEKRDQIQKERVAADAAVNDIVTSYEKKSKSSAEYQSSLKRSLVQARTYLQGLGVTVEDLKAAHQFVSQPAETTGNEPRKRTSSSHMNEAVLFLLDAAAWKKAVGLDMANPVFRQVAAMYHFPPDFWDRFQPKQRRLRGPIYRGKRSILKQ